MANGWIEVDKKNADGPKVVKKVPQLAEDEVQTILQKIKAITVSDVPDKTIQDLKKRKLIADMYCISILLQVFKISNSSK